MEQQEFWAAAELLASGGKEVFVALCHADLEMVRREYLFCGADRVDASESKAVLRRVNDLLTGDGDAWIVILWMPYRLLGDVADGIGPTKKPILIGMFASDTPSAAVACFRRR